MRIDYQLVVSGSRSIDCDGPFCKKEHSDAVKGIFSDKLNELHHKNNLLVLHGDAQGVDRCAGNWFFEMGVRVLKVPARWDLQGKRAGVIRNREMLVTANQLLAIWDCKSPGTKNAIQTAVDFGIKTHVYLWDPSKAKAATKYLRKLCSVSRFLEVSMVFKD